MRPSAEYLRSIFLYDRKTGIVTRKVATSPRVRIGDTVGSPATNGYLRVNVEGKKVALHHVIWCMETGEWPEHQVDHRDGCITNNRWRNLRAATQAQNNQNLGKRKSVIGLTGVTFNKRAKKYEARIGHHGTLTYLGLYNTSEEAHAAYLKAKKRLHRFQPVPR